MAEGALGVSSHGEGRLPVEEVAKAPLRVPVDSLSFLDLLYAVPVGDLAMRVSSADLAKVSKGDWANVAVCMTLIVLSWIGLHQNRAEMARRAGTHRGWISESDFLSLRFAQFALEVIIVALYFAMGLKINLPTADQAGATTPAMSWLAGTLLVVYVAYLVWDVLDVTMARRGKFDTWVKRARNGGVVTFIFTIVLAVFYGIIRSTTTTPDSALWWSLALIAVLYVYRVIQQNVAHRTDAGSS